MGRSDRRAGDHQPGQHAADPHAAGHYTADPYTAAGQGTEGYGAEGYGAEGYGVGSYEDHAAEDPDSPLSAGILVRTLRALSGSVAAGLVLLTLVVIGTAVIGGQRGFPGPGATSIGVHAGGAVVAVLLQRFADRRRDLLAALASLAVWVVAGGVLWTQWWN